MQNFDIVWSLSLTIVVWVAQKKKNGTKKKIFRPPGPNVLTISSNAEPSPRTPPPHSPCLLPRPRTGLPICKESKDDWAGEITQQRKQHFRDSGSTIARCAVNKSERKSARVLSRAYSA